MVVRFGCDIRYSRIHERPTRDGRVMLGDDGAAALQIDDLFSFDHALGVIVPFQLDATPSLERNNTSDVCTGGRTPAPDPGVGQRPHDAASDAMDEERKMRRMSRNRCAAATSRSRKREHVRAMQSEISELLDANAMLKDENALLCRLLCGHVAEAVASPRRLAE